ncbi:hypothetical protein BVRB_8g202150 [Beta vulgaris subsp. vulgaris]|uniref:Uncharacterized protein n=1 Tax=Beta vulgaris subsp. vulgaris TaxID=3555 RepID=A0A0J8B9L1_BETVV|nr:hypothetical protein BVRB_8g202150 [Beta vulgaris subsp. vulgaris]
MNLQKKSTTKKQNKQDTEENERQPTRGLIAREIS